MPTYNLKIAASDQMRINFAGIQKLWGPGGEAFRNELLAVKDQAAAHAMVNQLYYGFDIPLDVKIIVVDIDGARTSTFSASINPQTDEFYYLVLPPKPTKSKDLNYVAMQTSLEAYFHSSNDGYGL